MKTSENKIDVIKKQLKPIDKFIKTTIITYSDTHVPMSTELRKLIKFSKVENAK